VTSTSPERVDAVKARLHELKTRLEDAGLTAAVDENRWTVTATNGAAVPSEKSPLARAYGNVGLTQKIRIFKHDGQPHWCWEWSGETRDSPPGYQPICPVDDVEQVVTSLVRVLALVEQ
jgi:hypothetical protein